MDKTERHTCLIIACGALAKEIVVLKKRLGPAGEAITLQCLPAEYHNTPDKIVPGIEAILEERRADYDIVYIGYGDCGTGGGLDRLLVKYDIERLPGAHCYEFFAGSSAFKDIMEDELGSLFLTDYLVRHFDHIIIKGLGLDRFPHLRDIYFKNYKQIVYLAQIEDPELVEKAKQAADELSLNFVHRQTGYGDLAISLEALSQKLDIREADYVRG